MTKIFKQICAIQGWNFLALRGKQNTIPLGADVVIFMHSLINIDNIDTPFLGIHIVRDPRDIIVSGYLYHKRTNEAWCINKDHHIQESILFPQIPYSQEHRPEAWKKAYLSSLGEKSYQENLLCRSEAEGINFEMNNYGSWTINSMRNWVYGNPKVLEVRFEDIMSEYDKTLKMIFDHFQFDQKTKNIAVSIARRHDIKRKSPGEISNIRHVSSVQTTRWKEYFNHQLKREFIAKFDSVLIGLEYENDNSWMS